MRYVVRGVLVIGILVAAFFVYQSQKAKKQEAEEAVELAEMMAVRVGEDGDAEAELFKILWKYYEVESEREESVWDVVAAGKENSTNSVFAKEGTLLLRAIKDNYRRLEELGVFEDNANLTLMKQGLRPAIRSGTYAGAGRDIYVAAARIISPLFAPEAANALPNIILVPEPVAEIRTDEIDRFVRDTASKLKNAGIVTTESYNLIDDRFDIQEGRK